jgi:hypothetical protein
MSMRRSFAWTACVLAVALVARVTPARAADAPPDVEISRITVKLPDADWRVSDMLPYTLPVRDSGLSVGGESRLLFVGKLGTRGALAMLVTATRGQGRVTMHAECEPEDGTYVRKFNRGQANYIPLQCLRVEGPARIPKDVSTVHASLARAMAAQHVAAPPDGYLLTLTVCNDNGALVDIVALVGLDIVGLDAKPAVEALPADMPPAVAAWADRLGEEALGTLSSWSGRMSVPAVTFKASAPRPDPLNTAQAATAALED